MERSTIFSTRFVKVGKAFPGFPALAVLLTFFFFAGDTGSVFASEIPVVRGANWVDSSHAEKKAFLLGMATVIAAEREMQEEGNYSSCRSVVPVFVNAFKGYTLDDVLEELDGYFRSRPEELHRPVIEVLWYEMALPETAE